MNQWRTPAHCSCGDCAEWIYDSGQLLLRSTLQPEAIVTFTAQEAADLIAAIKAGELDEGAHL